MIRVCFTKKIFQLFFTSRVKHLLQSPWDLSGQTSPSVFLRPIKSSISFSLLKILRSPLDPTSQHLLRTQLNITCTSVHKLENTHQVNIHTDGWKHLVLYNFECTPLISPYMEKTYTPRPKTPLHIFILPVWEVKP